MTSPRVLNKRKHGVPAGAVYVGRPGKWGNPYSHTTGTLAKYKVDTREQAVELYRNHLHASGLIVDIDELRGKDLVCWCAPAACHADVLLELANRCD
jgi:hypothetical protein